MVSRRRNEEIADMFHEVRFVEKWGRGISLILDREPDADFEVVAGIFVTTFKRKHYVPSPTQKTVKKTRVEKFGEKFGENELKVIALLKQNSKITVLELAGKVGITTRGIEKILQRLKEKGVIKRIGSAKGGHWEVKE
jgi:ATP-dependent DNA helicase RecG